MASVRSFHRYRGESAFSLHDLVRILAEQLPAIAPTQSRYRVTELPTERTVRFYTARGIVDKPLTGAGGRACYGYRHLLQLIAVKYLQSQYLPLVKVKALVAGVDNRELEAMIPAIPPAAGTHRGIAGAGLPVVPGRVGEGPAAAPQPASAAETGGDGADAQLMDLWHRVEVAPGIELHVHAAALSVEQRERVRGALLRELGGLRGWFGGGEKT